MACCAVGAYIVFGFLKLHDDIFCSLYPKSAEEQAAKADNLPSPPAIKPLPRTQDTCVLSIGGIECASCVGDLQAVIGSIPGTLNATVSFALLRASITYIPDQVAEEAIVKAIHAAGYEARPASSAPSGSWAQVIPAIKEPEEKKRDQLATWRRAFAMSAMASVVMSAAQFSSTLMLRLIPGSRIMIDLISILMVVVSLISGSKVHMETARSIYALQSPGMSTLGTLGILLALARAILLYRADPRGAPHLQHLGVIPILSTSVLGARLLKALLSLQTLDVGAPLASLVPDATTVYCQPPEENMTVRIHTDMVSPGDRALILQGEKIPADGVITSHRPALVSEKWMNGSLDPRVVGQGSLVYAGCEVEEGSIVIEVKACGGSTRLGQMLSSLTAGELQGRQPGQTLAQHFGLSVIVLAAGVFAAHMYTSGTTTTGWADALDRVSAMLLAACPCALSLSIPTAKFLLTAVASRAGIRLVTDYTRIKDLAFLKSMLFDKTGTLTSGDLKIAHLHLESSWTPPLQQAALWNAVQQLESSSRHPVAQVLSKESIKIRLELGLPPSVLNQATIKDMSHELGRGATCTFRANPVPSDCTPRSLAIGSRKFLESLGVEVSLKSVPADLRSSVTTTVIIAVDGQQAATIVVEDAVRPEARAVVEELRRLGVKVGMITGDNHASAAIVARHVGIDAAMTFASLSPIDKADIVRRTRLAGPTVVVGDNLNDIIGFSAASFSFCIANEPVTADSPVVADATLTPISTAQDGNDTEYLKRILFLIRASRRTVQIVRQNLVWAGGYNAVVLVWASGLLGSSYKLSPLWADIGMGFSSFVVLQNSRRIGSLEKR